MTNLRTTTLGLVAGVAALALGGPALALDEITFGTNWVAEAEHGGFYQAVADGTYEKYGLKVTIIPKADQAMLLGGKIQFYMQGNLLGTFSAVEQDVPVIEVAAMFQKDPQIIMARPEAGLKEFGDLAKLKTLFIGDDLFSTGYRWMMATFPGITEAQRKPYNYSIAPFLAEMTVATLTANARGNGAQGAVAGHMVCGTDIQFGTYDAVHAALVINQAAWAEFGKRQKTRTTDHTAFVIFAACAGAPARGDPGHEWQAREIVTRQESPAG